MGFQIALNTIILLMMAVFPGFLFRKFYFVGEFTKQFNQGTQFDKLIWNIFFSSIAILFTILSIYLFKRVTNLTLMESISYDSIVEIVEPLQKSDMPEKEKLYRMYKDLIILVSLIYTFASFLGMICHFIVKTFRLDINFPLFRFNNYWYYYIHGGRILYNNKDKRKRVFTFADVLCEEAGTSQLYSGILSQYVIDRENNQLESIYLTNAVRYRRTLSQDGATKSVATKEIPGNTFCIPYSRVLNLNLTYYYKPVDEFKYKKLGFFTLNASFAILILSLVISLFFDLSGYGISGVLDKVGYFFWGFIIVSNLRLFFTLTFSLELEKDKQVNESKKDKFIAAITLILFSLNWLCYIVVDGNFWRYLIYTVLITFSMVIISYILTKINKE